MRPIDADVAIEKLTDRSYQAAKRVGTDSPFWEGLVIARRIVNNLPTIQPEPQEGEWIPVHPIQSDDPGAYMCSKCKTGMWEIRPSSYHYCPNCGADMRGGQDD